MGNYMPIRNIKGMEIVHVREEYARTSSGKSWRSKPESVETEEDYSVEHYNNFVSSCLFFKSRCYCGYTVAGYTPVRITTVSPCGTIKFVDRFIFKYNH